MSFWDHIANPTVFTLEQHRKRDAEHIAKRMAQPVDTTPQFSLPPRGDERFPTVYRREAIKAVKPIQVIVLEPEYVLAHPRMAAAIERANRDRLDFEWID